MNLEALVKNLDDHLRDLRIRGMNAAPEERDKYLDSCFQSTKFIMHVALLVTPILRPDRTPREVFEETVPKMIEKIAQQGRDSGYTEEQVRIYVEAHERAFRSVAGEFGFVEMNRGEFDSLRAS